MKGSVFKRKGGATWTIKYDLPRDAATGKRRTKMQAGFRRKEDAERALRRILGRWTMANTWSHPSSPWATTC